VNLSVSTPIWDLCSRLLGIDPLRLLLDKSLQKKRGNKSKKEELSAVYAGRSAGKLTEM
jgi:hypothetical protein